MRNPLFPSFLLLILVLNILLIPFSSKSYANSILSFSQTLSFPLYLFIFSSTFSFISPTHTSTIPLYDSSAYTQCKAYPEEPLYAGGILQDHQKFTLHMEDASYTPPTFFLHNLSSSFYTFSAWITISGDKYPQSLIRARLSSNNNVTYSCVGSVIAKQGCWSFLKGGFVLHSQPHLSLLFLQDFEGKSVNISIASASLQPFTPEQWRLNQEAQINMERKRYVTVHVSNMYGERLQAANLTIQHISKDYPFGSAISAAILGNLPYQKWFLKRFNAAVFENELKWYATEPEQGKTNYTIPDKMLEFVRADQITTRGHNIFWENPKYNPPWLAKLTSTELQQAVNHRIESLMSKYREEFIHWDVSNELLHFDFYEDRLGPNATLDFFKTTHQADPLATLFLNEYNVVETCDDANSTVDSYIEKLRELKRGGVTLEGIGLQGHFTVPNPPYIRAVLDKLGTLGLPVWLTEVDISHSIDRETQGVYMEQVLREGYSHPSVKGIILWTALDDQINGCYQMCLTDNNFNNLPAGDVVDKLLQEWETGIINDVSDALGSYSFHGFLGEYKVSVKYGNRSASSTFSLTGGDETKHFNIQL